MENTVYYKKEQSKFREKIQRQDIKHVHRKNVMVKQGGASEQLVVTEKPKD